MATHYYRLSGQSVKVEIPDNHAALRHRKLVLERDALALKKRRQRRMTNEQQRSAKMDLKAINQELLLVNRALYQFKRAAKRQKQKTHRARMKVDNYFSRKDIKTFSPESSDREKFLWAMSLLKITIRASEEGELNDAMRDDLWSQVHESNEWARDSDEDYQRELKLAKEMGVY